MTMTTAAGPLETAAFHAPSVPKSHAVLMWALALLWIGGFALAFVTFGLGGVITLATVTSWLCLGTLVVMTAGG